MQVLLNTDHHVDGSQQMADHLNTVVRDALGRFGDHVTRVEAHLADANSAAKATPDEIHCTLEARLNGRDPIVVKDHAGSAHQAIQGAVGKLKRAVSTVVDKQEGHRGGTKVQDGLLAAMPEPGTDAGDRALTASVSLTVHATPADVWEALTSPASLKKFFFGADVASDFAPGSPIRMSGEFKGKAYEDKGEILLADKERLLSFSHWSPLSGQADLPDHYHVVSFALEPLGKASTQVTLTQANLNGLVTPADLSGRADYEQNWKTVLDGLAKLFP